MNQNDDHWMDLAIKQAKLAGNKGEVPVGAIIVDENQQLIACAHNAPISENDPTSHAEINVLRKAAQALGNYRLNNMTLYVTLEPCVMCVGAMIHSRIHRLVYGAKEYKTGAVDSVFKLINDQHHNHQIIVTAGVQNEICSELLSNFFKQRRLEKKHA